MFPGREDDALAFHPVGALGVHRGFAQQFLGVGAALGGSIFQDRGSEDAVGTQRAIEDKAGISRQAQTVILRGRLALQRPLLQETQLAKVAYDRIALQARPILAAEGGWQGQWLFQRGVHLFFAAAIARHFERQVVAVAQLQLHLASQRDLPIGQQAMAFIRQDERMHVATFALPIFQRRVISREFHLQKGQSRCPGGI